jgi:hypothetical protein
MAAGDFWPQNWATTLSSSASTYTYTMSPLTVYSGGTSLPVPRPQTALEWLDAEVEAVCKLARQAA